IVLDKVALAEDSGERQPKERSFRRSVMAQRQVTGEVGRPAGGGADEAVDERRGDPERSAVDASPTSWSRIAVLTVGVATLLLLVVTAFAWPAVNSGPHEVPL